LADYLEGTVIVKSDFIFIFIFYRTHLLHVFYHLGDKSTQNVII